MIEVAVVCDTLLCMLKKRSFKTGVDAHSDDQAIGLVRQLARERGWKSTGIEAPDQDLCPDCYKKEQAAAEKKAKKKKKKKRKRKRKKAKK